jgi:CBS domain-containing protein
LLPVRPTIAFPAAPVAAVAAITDDDLMKKYLADGGNFRVFVMTPPVMAWRDARARDALAKLKSTPAGAALSLSTMDPIQGWSGWDPCIRARCALVAINVVPDRTPFLFHRIGVVDFSRGNVRSITLLRDGVPVEAIETAYFPAVLNVAEQVAAQKPVFSQGVALYRAREFAPKPTGGMARFELSIVDATRPDRPVRIALPPALAQTIINDFAPYGLTR